MRSPQYVCGLHNRGQFVIHDSEVHLGFVIYVVLIKFIYLRPWSEDSELARFSGNSTQLNIYLPHALPAYTYTYTYIIPTYMYMHTFVHTHTCMIYYA